MPAPYLPEGSGQVPATRFVLFADGSNNVQLFDESVRTKAGLSFEGQWKSPSLNREELADSIATLRLLTLFYYAGADTTIRVRASGDGGENWNEEKQVSVFTTTKRRAEANISFETTGADLRFQILLDTDIIVLPIGYIVRLIRRGGYEYA